MEVGVLTPDKHVVVEDDRRAVPVVVPPSLLDRISAQTPQFNELASVERQDSKLVVARSHVDEWVTVGVNCERTLNKVARGKRGHAGRASHGIEHVHVAVVGAERDPQLAASFPYRGLACPSGAAPFAFFIKDRRHRTHFGPGVAPLHSGRVGYRTLAVVGAVR